MLMKGFDYLMDNKYIQTSFNMTSSKSIMVSDGPLVKTD